MSPWAQSTYKFPDGLVGGSDSALVSTAAAELKFNRNPAIHHHDIVKQYRKALTAVVDSVAKSLKLLPTKTPLMIAVTAVQQYT